MRAVAEFKPGRNQVDQDRDCQHPDVMMVGIVDVPHDEREREGQCQNDDKPKNKTFQLHFSTSFLCFY